MTVSSDQWDRQTYIDGSAETAAPAVKPTVVLWLIAAGASAAVALAGVSAPPPLRFNLPLVAHVSGLLAGYAVDRDGGTDVPHPCPGRGVGAERLARWHGMGGRAIVGLILVHGVAATVAWAMGQGTSVPGRLAAASTPPRGLHLLSTAPTAAAFSDTSRDQAPSSNPRSVKAFRTALPPPSLLKYTKTSLPEPRHSRIRSAHHRSSSSEYEPP